MTQTPSQQPYQPGVPGQPGQPGMYVPPGGGSLKPHRGTMILVFGILGLVCCGIFAILAWIMGAGDLREMNAGRMDPSGRGSTNAGKVLGIVGVCLQAVGIIIWVIMLIVGGGSAWSFKAGNL